MLAERLTQAGLEVETLQPLYPQTGAIIGRVRELRPHPDSEHLKLCRVDTGSTNIPIVCGAPNVKAGMKAPVARVGTVLPSGDRVEKRSIRGEPSEGMLCSERELGLSQDHSGIMALPRSAPVGRPLTDFLGLDDWLIELGVTPNRGDCLGLLGLARETAALFGARVKQPPAKSHTDGAGSNSGIEIQIQDASLCPRYSARLLHDIHATDSPLWLRFRLEACGIRSINSIVDVTNYVMLETGQPLHAFDAGRLTEGRIVVRAAGRNGKFTTLDGAERDLEPQDLLICNGDTPVALAGIMGGLASEVRADTRSVLLESAHFDSRTIRRTSKRLGLHTEASHRFERGVDPEGTVYALNRAALLLEQTSGAHAMDEINDRYAYPAKPVRILVNEERVGRLLGVEIGRKDIRRILRSLGIGVKTRTSRTFEAVVPSYRFDLCREADLVEEVARLYGYDRIPATLPTVRCQGHRADEFGRMARKVRAMLLGEGFTEVIHVPFTSGAMNGRFPGLWQQPEPVPVVNPLRQDSAELRLSLAPGLIEDLIHHVEQKASSLLVFELSKTFRLRGEGQFEETTNLGGLIYGQRPRLGLGHAQASSSFYDLKGVVEGILDCLGIEARTWSREQPISFLHPGKSVSVFHGTTLLGILGALHPQLCDELKFPSVLLFELDFNRLLHYARPDFKVRPVPRFPHVERDLAVIVEENFPSLEITKWFKGLGHDWIEDVIIFDEYKGAPIGRGQKSLAYKVLYRSPGRTLTDQEVNRAHDKLTARLCEAFGATLRQ